MTNRYRDRLLVLPEDRANEEIVNGFIQNLNVNECHINVERIAGGWVKVVEKFNQDLVPIMDEYKKTWVVLLIDFDKDKDRLSWVKDLIPEDLKERVFVLGVLSNPEDLKNNINKSFEKIGESLANDCAENTNHLWGHDLLKHNKTELDRMIASVKPFLFVG